jgi:hypothetical protein
VSLSDVSDESGVCIFEDQDVLEDLSPQANVCLKKYSYQRGVPIVSPSVFVRSIVSETSYMSFSLWHM